MCSGGRDSTRKPPWRESDIDACFRTHDLQEVVFEQEVAETFTLGSDIFATLCEKKKSHLWFLADYNCNLEGNERNQACANENLVTVSRIAVFMQLTQCLALQKELETCT